MDWRDFMRGFFGTLPPRSGGRETDQWPPPPPIPGFQDEDEHIEDPYNNHGQGFFRGSRNRGGDDRGGVENFGNRFVFGNIFSAMDEMFREMERSMMKDMEGFFGNMAIEDDSSRPKALPPQKSPEMQPHSKNNNLRDFVLKEPDSSKEPGSQQNSKHYIPVPDNPSEKVDRDLDDLHKNSMLDLSDLPVPNTSGHQSDSGGGQHLHLSPFGFGRGGSGNSSYQKSFQTFTFKNGRWEGEIIKEDRNGKEVTRYHQDKDGQRHETTEYFPKNGSPSFSPHQPAILDSSNTPDIYFPPPTNEQAPRFFQFIDRFFKPRM